MNSTKLVLFFVVIVGSSLYAMDMDEQDDFVAKQMRQLEAGTMPPSDTSEGIDPRQLTDHIYKKKRVQDTYLRAHLLLMVEQLYEKDEDRYARLAAEVTRAQSDEVPKPEIDKLYAALIQIGASLQEANELRQEQMAGDDADEEVQRCRWHMDNCREWTIGLCGVFGASLITFLGTYFGVQSTCTE